MDELFRFETELPHVANVGDKFNWPLIVSLRTDSGGGVTAADGRTLVARLAVEQRFPELREGDDHVVFRICGLVDTDITACYRIGDRDYFVFAPDLAEEAFTVKQDWAGKTYVFRASVVEKDAHGGGGGGAEYFTALVADSTEMSVNEEFTAICHKEDVNKVHARNKTLWMDQQYLLDETSIVNEWAMGPVSNSTFGVTYSAAGRRGSVPAAPVAPTVTQLSSDYSLLAITTMHNNATKWEAAESDRLEGEELFGDHAL
ncbi:hypothetical protein N3K66_004173 [Trichothecium roseum]|uniref:Uncharacterized protein n=1 Tax=Trichothecium roseum TaxID=47278 RepID=A0ACC0V2A4_9HYPO|nr:hypothetical protein N3K66_004173 [Trichothecium roseum]